MIGTNCYLVINEETKDTVMVDPGAYPTKLKNAVKEQGLKLKGTCRNIYLEGPPHHKDKSEFVTQVALPLVPDEL